MKNAFIIKYLQKNHTHILTEYLLIHQESEKSEEQCKLEEVLRTPESTLRLDATLPRNRRRMSEIQGAMCDQHVLLICAPLSLYLPHFHTETIFVYFSASFSRKLKW